eukprot:1754766-Pyramimonas_sp.AAC.1
MVTLAFTVKVGASTPPADIPAAADDARASQTYRSKAHVHQHLRIARRRALSCGHAHIEKVERRPTRDIHNCALCSMGHQLGTQGHTTVRTAKQTVDHHGRSGIANLLRHEDDCRGSG